MTFNKILIFFSVISFLLIVAVKLHSSSNGITGLTKKTGAVGCVCHGNHKPSPNISVFFLGPDSVAAGQTSLFVIKLAHGPAVKGGFDVASYSGMLDTTYSDTTVKRDTSNGELTHRFPKSFTNDTVFWTFKYTAPNTAQIDTLYAVANSTNNDSKADTLDQWNFSVNRTVRVYVPIGISSNELKVNSFILYQNYPNPFNPSTVISYQLAVNSFVTLIVYDILGREIAILVNKELKVGSYEAFFDSRDLIYQIFPSGVYFYKLTAGESTDTKKMILIK